MTPNTNNVYVNFYIHLSLSCYCEMSYYGNKVDALFSLSVFSVGICKPLASTVYIYSIQCLHYQSIIPRYLSGMWWLTCWWWATAWPAAVWACRWCWVRYGSGCPGLSCSCCYSVHSSICSAPPANDSSYSSHSSAKSPCERVETVWNDMYPVFSC